MTVKMKTVYDFLIIRIHDYIEFEGLADSIIFTLQELLRENSQVAKEARTQLYHALTEQMKRKGEI